jgi:hypothetical protein
MHCNVKPPRGAIYETADQAIHHMFMFGMHVQSHWQDWHFGRDLALIRKATAAIRAKDYSAFTASRRRGYWRIELAEAA